MTGGTNILLNSNASVNDPSFSSSSSTLNGAGTGSPPDPRRIYAPSSSPPVAPRTYATTSNKVKNGALGVDLIDHADAGLVSSATPSAEESWSTAATPGTAPGVVSPAQPAGRAYGWGKPEPDEPEYDAGPYITKGKGKSKDEKKEKREKRRSGSGSSSNGSGSGSSIGHRGDDDGIGGTGVSKPKSQSKKARVSDEFDKIPSTKPSGYVSNGNANATALGLNNPSSRKAVHFTPSVQGGLSSTGGTPAVSPGWSSGEDHGPWDNPNPKRVRATSLLSRSPISNPNPMNAINPLVELPAGFVPDPSAFHGPGQEQRPGKPQGKGWLPGQSPPKQYQNQKPQIYAPSPPSNASIPARSSQPAPAPPSISPPSNSPPRQPPVQAPPPPPPQRQSPPQPPQPSPEFELTPTTIAKAQKHCRFAISALDYEDAEQARKELRAALAVLGG